MRKKNTWGNLFGTILAGTTITAVMVTAKQLAKKYGQRANPDKLFEVNVGKVVTYAIDKFLETDNDELVKSAEQLSEVIEPKEK